MALPVPLRVSVTPPELELIASQEIVEIVPLITMEKTAFISVVFTHEKPQRDLLICMLSSRVLMAHCALRTKPRSLYGWL
jgi:hypothetical protein